MTNFKLQIFYLLICLFAYLLIFTIPVKGQSPTATSSSEDKARQILEAVKERIRERQLEPKRKAYVGTLKSIADTTLILETKNGIKQAKVSTEATILRLEEETKKEMKFEDLVIGELTIAMGYLDENEVLQTKRVIISLKPKEETKREAICGMAEEVNLTKKIIEIKRLKEEEVYTLKITSKTEMTQKSEEEMEKISLEEIEPGDRLLAVGLPEEEEKNLLTAHRIHLLLRKTD